MPHPFVETRFCTVRNEKGNTLAEQEEILDVDERDGKCDSPGSDGDRPEIPGQKEEVESGSHKKNVEESEEENKGSPDDQHSGPRTCMNQEAEQKEKNEEGTGVETVQSAKDDRDHR